MATHLSIDPELLERAIRVSGEKTAAATVDLALRELVARRDQARLVELFGSLDLNPDFVPKTERDRS